MLSSKLTNRILVQPGMMGIGEEGTMYIFKCVELETHLYLCYSYLYIFLKCKVAGQHISFHLDGLQINMNKRTP